MDRMGGCRLVVLSVFFGLISGFVLMRNLSADEEVAAASQTESSSTESEGTVHPVVLDYVVSEDNSVTPSTDGNSSETVDVRDSESEISPSENPNAPDARVEIPDLVPVDPGEDSKRESPFSYDPADEEPTVEPDAEAVEESEVQPTLHSIIRAGFPLAQDAVKEMYEDIVNGINTRHTGSSYRKWQSYAAGVLARTKGRSTGLELNNRCRLSWYEKLYRDPISSVFYAEEFTREAYEDFAGDTYGLINGLRQARSKMDLSPARNVEPFFVTPQTPQQAVIALGYALTKAKELHSDALTLLKPEEVKLLTTDVFTIFCAQTHYGHTVSMVGKAQSLIDLMEKINGAAMYDAAETLLPMLDSRVIEELKKIEPDMFEEVRVDGQRCQRIATPAGNIVIGGPEDNVWNLDTIEDLVCLIDLGGNDTYREGTCNPNRPVLMIMDLGEGDDQYEGTRPGIQGGSILGVSILYDEKGNDFYKARDIAQGATIGGIGILIDNDGEDRYLGFKRVQGCAMEGFGALIDYAGDDQYRAALLAQGLGNPRGFGMILDKKGNDHYYVGGYYEDSYPEHPGYDGWGQGIGCGVRGVACGGIGLLLEGDGDDVYEFDYFGHGGGYWMAVGFARDFGGNDQRIGATLKSYTNTARTQSRWQRFSNGFGCHYAVGFLFDDAGNDSYNGTIMGLGMAWDLSAGFLVDFDGDDSYEATGGLTQGTGAEGSLGFLLDYRGEDDYKGRNQGYAGANVTYHQSYDCGGNFSFVVDHGGMDTYGSGSKNNMMSQRGTAQGFIIDRPTDAELAMMGDEAEAVRQRVARPSQQNMPTIDAAVEMSQADLSNSMNNRNQSNMTGPFGGMWRSDSGNQNSNMMGTPFRGFWGTGRR